MATVTPGNNNSTTLTAPCNAGETAIAGGYLLPSNSNAVVTGNRPNGTSTGWSIAFRTANGELVTAYVVCKL
jgi:hypothetical protein